MVRGRVKVGGRAGIRGYACSTDRNMQRGGTAGATSTDVDLGLGLGLGFGLGLYIIRVRVRVRGHSKLV